MPKNAVFPCVNLKYLWTGRQHGDQGFNLRSNLGGMSANLCACKARIRTLISFSVPVCSNSRSIAPMVCVNSKCTALLIYIICLAYLAIQINYKPACCNSFTDVSLTSQTITE